MSIFNIVKNNTHVCVHVLLSIAKRDNLVPYRMTLFLDLEVRTLQCLFHGWYFEHFLRPKPFFPMQLDCWSAWCDGAIKSDGYKAKTLIQMVLEHLRRV